MSGHSVATGARSANVRKRDEVSFDRLNGGSCWPSRSVTRSRGVQST